MDSRALAWQRPWNASLGTWAGTGSGIDEKLTSREFQVALAVAEGRSNRDVASLLFISPKTVEYHLGNVFGKLGVTSRTQLALALVRSLLPQPLLDPPQDAPSAHDPALNVPHRPVSSTAETAKRPDLGAPAGRVAYRRARRPPAECHCRHVRLRLR